MSLSTLLAVRLISPGGVKVAIHKAFLMVQTSLNLQIVLNHKYFFKAKYLFMNQ